MKNQILKIITLIFLFSSAYGDITVYNDSNLDLYFESDLRPGCTGICTNPWTGGPIAPGSCCGDAPLPVKGKTYQTDPSQTGTIVLHSGAPAWTGLGYNYAVWARAQDGRGWLSWTAHDPAATLHFPADFNVYPASTLAAITPAPAPLTQAAIDTLGFLVNIVNASSINFMVKGHPTPTQTTTEASLWQDPSSKFPDLWDTNKTLQIVGQLGNLNRTITLIPTAHSLTIQDAISGQNVSSTTTSQMLDLDSIIAEYFGQSGPTSIVTGWGVSLKITDQDVQITDVQIYRQYISQGAIIYDAYWIYPDQVLHGDMTSASAQPAWATKGGLGKPKLARYIIK